MKYWWLYIEIPMVAMLLYVLCKDIAAICKTMRK